MSKKHTCISYIVSAFFLITNSRRAAVKCFFSRRNSTQNNFVLEYFSTCFYLSSMHFPVFMPVWFKYHRGNKGLLFDWADTSLTFLPRSHTAAVFILCFCCILHTEKLFFYRIKGLSVYYSYSVLPILNQYHLLVLPLVTWTVEC